MTIILEEQGIRYRCNAPWTEDYLRAVIRRYPQGIAEAERPSISCAYSIQPLPRIPDWPLPGLAPQYLADDDFADRIGDVIIGNFGPNHWDFIFPKKNHEGMNSRLNKRAALPTRFYLVTRKDPTEDA